MTRDVQRPTRSQVPGPGPRRAVLVGLGTVLALALAGAGSAEEPDKGDIVAAYRASRAALEAGEMEKAITEGERALALATERLGAEHKTTGILAYNLARIYTDQERWAEARRSYTAALVGYEATYGKEDPELVPVLDGLGEAQGRLEAYAAARASFERALALTEKAHGEESDEVGELLQKMGLVAQQQGEARDAMSYGKRALKIFKQTRGEEDVQVGILYFGLGMLEAQTGDLEAAQRNTDKGEDILAEALPPGHPYLIGLYDFMADQMKQFGQTAKARRYERKAEEQRAAAEQAEPSGS